MEDIYKIKECIVHNCVNDSSQGEMVGDLCWPCHMFITGQQSSYSQAYRNAKEVVPKGYALVPIEPTEAMLKATQAPISLSHFPLDIYTLMIKAAQEKS